MNERQDSARHKYIPRQLSLLTFGENATGGPYTARFRVPIPDSRMRVKISVLWVPKAGETASDGSLDADLWLSETELEDAGVQGATIATTNIEGTEAAPTAIPAAAGLQGYSREFVSAADFIEGRLRSTPIETEGTWVLQTRYQPDAVRFTNDEWREITSQCNPTVIASRRVLT